MPKLNRPCRGCRFSGRGIRPPDNSVCYGLAATVLIWFFLWSSMPVWAQSGRQTFENWMAVFEKEGRAYCRPWGYLYSNRKVPDFQIRVVRENQVPGCAITLCSAFRFVDLTREILVRVDAKPGLRLDGRLARTKGKTLQVYTVTDSATVNRLLDQMRAGTWIRFDYSDRMGQRLSTSFSLMGVSAALDAVGCGQVGR